MLSRDALRRGEGTSDSPAKGNSRSSQPGAQPPSPGDALTELVTQLAASTLQDAMTPEGQQRRHRASSSTDGGTLSDEEVQQLRKVVGRLLGERDTEASKAEAAVVQTAQLRQHIDQLEARLVLLAGQASEAGRDATSARAEADATLARHEATLGQLRAVQGQLATVLDSRGSLMVELRRTESAAEAGFVELSRRLSAEAAATAPALSEVRELAAYLHARSDVLLEMAGVAALADSNIAAAPERSTTAAKRLSDMAATLRAGSERNPRTPSTTGNAVDAGELPPETFGASLGRAMEAVAGAAAAQRHLAAELADATARGLQALAPLQRLLPTMSPHPPGSITPPSAPEGRMQVMISPQSPGRDIGKGPQPEALSASFRDELASAVCLPNAATHASDAELWAALVGDVSDARAELSSARMRAAGDDGSEESLSGLAAAVTGDLEALLRSVLRLHRLSHAGEGGSARSSRRSTAESVQSGCAEGGLEAALAWLEAQRSAVAVGSIDVAADLELLKQRLVEAQVDNRTLAEEALHWKAAAEEALGEGADLLPPPSSPRHPLEYPSSASGAQPHAIRESAEPPAEGSAPFSPGSSPDEVPLLRAEVDRLRRDAEAATEAALLADAAAEEARREVGRLREAQLGAAVTDGRAAAEAMRAELAGALEARRAAAADAEALRGALRREQAQTRALFAQLDDLEGEAQAALQVQR